MPRDPASTRAALLAAAREEFAANGIAGSRVDRIAERAGVNKERIYGHFGSKESLFDAVLSEAIREFAGILDHPMDDPAAYVGRIFDYHLAHPTLLRLLLWQALQSTDAGLAMDGGHGAAVPMGHREPGLGRARMPLAVGNRLAAGTGAVDGIASGRDSVDRVTAVSDFVDRATAGSDSGDRATAGSDSGDRATAGSDSGDRIAGDGSQSDALNLLALIGLASWPHAVPWLGRLILGEVPVPEDLRTHLMEIAEAAISGIRMDGPGDEPIAETGTPPRQRTES